MRAPTDMPQASRGGSHRGRIALVGVAVVLLNLLVTAAFKEK